MPGINLNQVTLAGNLTRDPELRYLNSGTAVAQVSLAVNNRIKKGDEWVDDPCFIDVVVFGKSAEYIGQNVDKGQPVLVTGRLQFRSWQAQDGTKRSKHEVVADRIQAINASKSSSGREPGSDDEPVGRGSSRDDDVPF
jgi:single-strand DNA-binding protein